MRVGAYILCGPFGWLVKYRFHGRRLVGSGGRSRGEGYRDHGGMRWGKNQSRTMPITIHPAKAPAVTCAILRRTGCASIHATPSTNLSPAYRRNSKFAPRRFIKDATATTTARKAMSSVMSSTMGIISWHHKTRLFLQLAWQPGAVEAAPPSLTEPPYSAMAVRASMAPVRRFCSSFSLPHALTVAGLRVPCWG